MANRYETLYNETVAQIDVLRSRAERWAVHPTLHTRVDGVKAELAKLEAELPKLRGTAKLAKEMWG